MDTKELWIFLTNKEFEMKEIFNQKITAYREAKAACNAAEASMDAGTGTEEAWDASYKAEFEALQDFVDYLSGLLKIDRKIARKMIIESIDKIEALVLRLAA
jgi:hypothetical protein